MKYYIRIITMNKKVIVFLVVFVLLIGAGIFLGPRITGYAVLKEKQQEFEIQQQEYEKLIASYEKNFTDAINTLNLINKSLVSCEENRDKTYTQLEDYMNKTLICKAELRDIEEDGKTEKENIRDDLDECEDDLAEKYHQYNELVNSAGNKLCCVMKIYNKNIDSFDVEEYEIKCREGRNGEHRIFCEVLD